MFACLLVCLFVRSFICLAICCLFAHTHHSRKSAFVALLLESELRSTMVFRFHTASISWKIVTKAGKNPWKNKIFVWMNSYFINLEFLEISFGWILFVNLLAWGRLKFSEFTEKFVLLRFDFKLHLQDTSSFSVRLGFVCSLLRLHICACLRHLWAYFGCI